MLAEASGYSRAHAPPCLTDLTREMGGSNIITYPWLAVSLVFHSRVPRVRAHTRRPHTTPTRCVGPPEAEPCRVQDSSASPRLAR